MAAYGPSTPDRILDAALKLFNESGYANVPSVRVAEYLGISPGHVAYHFKSKLEMVLAVFPRIEEDVRGQLESIPESDRPFTPEVAARHQVEMIRLLWKYRFVFNALTVLLQDPGIRRHFTLLEETIVATTQGLFDGLIRNGDMRRGSPPSTTRVIARNVWMVWLSWLRFEQIAHPGRETVRNEAILGGVIQAYSIVQPYFEESFTRKMLKSVRVEIGIGKTLPARARRSASPGRLRRIRSTTVG